MPAKPHPGKQGRGAPAGRWSCRKPCARPPPGSTRGTAPATPDWWCPGTSSPYCRPAPTLPWDLICTAGVDARAWQGPGDRRREHRLLRGHLDPHAHRGRGTRRRGQPTQQDGSAHGRQFRPARRRADRSSRAGPDLNRHPEGQVWSGRGHPHPAGHPRQRRQGTHAGVQHTLGRHDRCALAAAGRARGVDQAHPGQPVPAAAPRDRRPAHPHRPPPRGSCWPR